MSRRTLKLCLVSLLLAVCTLLSGCSDTYKQIKSTDEELSVVGQVAGKDVYLDELMFAVATCREQMISAYGEGIFEGKDAEKYLSMLRERVLSGITANYATLLLCEECMIGLGEDAVLARVDEKMQELVDELGGMKEYKKYLEENALTDRYLRFYTEITLLQSELMYVYTDDLSVIETDDGKIYDIIKDEFIVVRHVFVPHSESDVMSLVEEELLNGESLSALISEYDRDSEMTADGQFILKGHMSKEYEEAAYALEVGEVSGVVEDANGLYIIERMEMSPADIMLQFDYLKELYQTYTFYSLIDQKQAELTFIPNDAGNSYLSSVR